VSIKELLAVLFPHLAGVCVERVSLVGRSVRIQARTRDPEAACPGCGITSRRVHSRYDRQLSDTPVAGQVTLLVLRVRRFFCSNDRCGKKTFAEQIPGLTVRHGRRSSGLREALRAIAVALGGRAGERLTTRLATGVGRSTLLRLVRGTPDPRLSTPRVLGVDDFAWRRGTAYGTVLVDVETHRPVDLLPDRSAESVAAWLDAHPGVEVICRDRAGCYAEGAQRGAPLAIQVADRWHLLHNLSVAVERVVARHRSNLREPHRVPEPPAADSAAADEDSALAARTRARHAEVHQAVRRGLTITAIGRDLRLDRKTVRRYASAASAEELIGDERRSRDTILDAHLPYLHKRWDEGCRSTKRLLRELRSRGYRGSERTLRRCTAQLRAHSARTTPPPAPKVREVTGWILTPLDKLTAEDHQTLQQISDRCPEIATTIVLTRQFAEMLVQLRGKDLDDWADRAAAGPVRELRSFAAGLRRDWDAVKAGLTLPYSSGVVEGNVNRIKMIKRQMYGRANHELLRKRVLLME
jgi:transposase